MTSSCSESDFWHIGMKNLPSFSCFRSTVWPCTLYLNSPSLSETTSGSTSSANFWSLPPTIPATIFPTMSNSEMPLQFSHCDKSPFLGTGTRIASDHFWGTLLSLQEEWNRSKKWLLNDSTLHATFNISGKIPLHVPPAALPFLSLFTASNTSAIVERLSWCRASQFGLSLL